MDDMFSETLEYVTQNEIFEPTNARTVKLHKAIYKVHERSTKFNS